MSQTKIYQAWKARTRGVIGDGQCVSLIVNNLESYVESLWPGANWQTIIKPVASAKDLPSAANPVYLRWIANDHADVTQLPIQGDIMVFDATPHEGYANTFENPDGHTVICDAASPNMYIACQQNAPALGQGMNVTQYPWNFRPCLGWLRPILSGVTPLPTSTPASARVTITLPATTGPWHLRDVNNFNHILGVIDPRAFNRALIYDVIGHPSQYLYTIKSDDYGIGNIDVQGSDVIIQGV